MDSVSTQQYVPPLIVCPYVKFRNKEDEFRLIQFGDLSVLPLPDAENDVSSFPTLSPPDVHLLDLCYKEHGQDYYYACGVCTREIVSTPFYTCKSSRHHISAFFHKECVEPISKHPYHPKHLLRFVEEIIQGKVCLCCSRSRYQSYSCSICDFTMCRDCSTKPPLLEINHPKRHEHTLLYFPINGSSSTCNVCALSDHTSLMYTCLQCDFVVHRECVYFPCMIRISRHEHRLSFTSSLTSERWLCGVCRRKTDTNYGRYSCVKGCSYTVHSKCATRYDVWDGKELEGTPEDAYEEETKSFIEISDGIIQHFSHKNHHMRIDEDTNRAFDETKRCQACALPICDDIIYSCVQSDFILHQECAFLPRKKQHAMHPHPLTLKVDNQKVGFSGCTTCLRILNDFEYTCCERGCDFQLDVCCASVSEPYHYQHHPHPLFLTSTPLTSQICSICGELKRMCLNCGECSFVLCFRCATLPNKMRYKYDEHYLALFYDKDASGQYWCDVCEEEADPKYGVFMCNDCNVTLHHECLLGREEMHLLPGGILKLVSGDSFKLIATNRRLTRNICASCRDRCLGKMVYESSTGYIFCSFRCLLDVYFPKHFPPRSTKTLHKT